MELKEIFNTVKTHLLTQNRRAYNDDIGCVYLNDSGLKCAVGCLIPDHLYDENMENAQAGECLLSDSEDMNPNNKILKSVLTEVLGGINQEKMMLLARLQNVHDSHTVDTWAEKLDAIELSFNLGD